MTITLGTEYVAVSCGKTGCHQVFAMSLSFYNETQREKATWYCPSGHPRVWLGDSPEGKLKKAEAREGALKDQLAAAVRDAENLRVTLIRDRYRFANGVCPCCSRTFENVRRHMSAKHPDYDIAKIATPVKAKKYECSCSRSFDTPTGLAIHQGRLRRPGWDKPAASRRSAHLTKI